MSTSKNYMNLKLKIKSFLIYQKMWNIKSISFCGIIHPIIIILLIFCNFIATKCCIFSMKQKMTFMCNLFCRPITNVDGSLYKKAKNQSFEAIQQLCVRNNMNYTLFTEYLLYICIWYLNLHLFIKTVWRITFGLMSLMSKTIG